MTMAVRDENQLAAFLNNGWVLDDTPTEKTVKPVEKEVVKGDKPTEGNVTKEDISKMPFFGLKSLAMKNDVKVEKGVNVDVLRNRIIEKMGL